MKKALIFAGQLLLIAAMMFTVFAIYAETVGHPLKILCL